MKTAFDRLVFLMLIPVTLFGQSGSINNKLGTGGTFTVKNDANAPLLVVDELGNTDITGQMTADRVKVAGVPSFTAYHFDETDLGGSDTLLNWSEVTGYGSHDNSNSFDPTTGQFVAPRNGFYFFSAGIELSTGSATVVTLYIMANSQVTSLTMRGVASGGGAPRNTSGILKLNSGDVVTVRVTMTGLVGTATAGLGWFSGYLVSDF